jgi:hypothetical protein
VIELRVELNRLIIYEQHPDDGETPESIETMEA